MAAVIGALRVDLGLNSAEFSAGLKKASAGLNNFAKVAGAGLALVATAAAAAGVALGYAVKGAIDNADQMGELAQSVGVSVEALTRLGYAAKMSGVDTEVLATGLRKLSQNMLVIAQGSTGPAATAFNALGISVQNANGTLVSSDAVLLQVAEKFSQFEDGATKTALAVQLFGRSGAELIPFLNQGAAGIGALTAEADRLGVTISGNTANAAGQFNDTLDRLNATFQGVINKIMQGALPSLNQFANKLADPAFAAAAAALAQGIVGAINLIIDAIGAASSKLSEFGKLLEWMGSHDWSTGALDPAKVEALERGAMAEVSGQLSRGEMDAPDASFLDSIYGTQAPAETNTGIQETSDVLTELSTKLNEVGGGASSAASGTSALNAAMAEGKSIYEATRTPAEAYSLEVERLNGLLAKGAIDQDTYNRAVIQAQDAMQGTADTGNEWATTLSNGLANVFGAVIDGSGNALDAVESLVQALAKMAITKGFEMLFGAAFGGFGMGSGMSGTSSITGSSGGFFPGFANGTNFAPGGMAMVGERGPELVNLPRGSQVIPNHELGSRKSGLNVTIDARGAQMGVAEQIEQWARFKLPSLVNNINDDPLARG